MTLDALERLFRTLFQNTCLAFSEPTTKISMKIDLYYQRQERSAMTVVTGNMRFMRIYMEGVRRQWGNRKLRFSGLSGATSSAP